MHGQADQDQRTQLPGQWPEFAPVAPAKADPAD
jgi:hypothetical protein